MGGARRTTWTWGSSMDPDVESLVKGGHWEEAEALLLGRIETFAEGEPKRAETLTLLGGVLGAQADWERAVSTFREALMAAAAQDEGGKRLRLTCALNLADALLRVGKLEESLEVASRNVTERRETFGLRHPAVALALETTARIYHEQGEYFASLSAAREAASIFAGAGHPGERGAQALVQDAEQGLVVATWAEATQGSGLSEEAEGVVLTLSEEGPALVRPPGMPDELWLALERAFSRVRERLLPQ